MRCNDFDVHIDEMLSGILHPDANQHMRQCERCSSYFRARGVVQHGLQKLASVAASGPSHATDHAVMASYRRLQHRRAAATELTVEPPKRLFTFPNRGLAPAWASRTWWTGAAAAAVVLAVLGSAEHLWNGVPTVNAPVVASAPAVSAPQRQESFIPAGHLVAAVSASKASGASQRGTQGPVLSARGHASPAGASRSEVALAAISGSPVLAANDSAPVPQLSRNEAPVMRLASTGMVSSVAQSASSTWPGYSNLMYCDPVVCSGPMQVVHIKVPVGQVKPNLGQTVGNGFVNAEVVVGPDGVARAIRVAN